MTVREATRAAADRLAAAGCPSPSVDAEWLLGHVVSATRSELALGNRALTEDERDRFHALLDRRAAREPLAYVLGEWGFRGLTLAVDPRVLVPRPETEIVVERCLALLAGIREPRVLDIGVGSGAIALAIAAERPDARVVATDTSRGALEVAEANRRRLAVDGRVELLHGDLLAGAEGPFDLVVSNPPYVRPEEYERGYPELRFEPVGALVGVGRHEAVAQEVSAVLRAGAPLVLEVGDGQASAVAATLRELGYLSVAVTPDLAGRERVVDGSA